MRSGGEEGELDGRTCLAVALAVEVMDVRSGGEEGDIRSGGEEGDIRSGGEEGDIRSGGEDGDIRSGGEEGDTDFEHMSIWHDAPDGEPATVEFLQ